MQATPYTLPTLVSGLIAAATAVAVYRKRPRPTASLEFVVVAVAVMWMSFAYCGELTASSLDAKLAWLRVRYVGICAMPLACMALALRWSGRDRWLTRRRLVLYAVVPVISLLLGVSNGWHHLMGTPSVLVPRDGFVMRQAEAGPAFWVFVVHAYLCLLVVLSIYGRATLSSGLFRRQGAILLVATALPWLANILYVFDSDPLFDVSHVGYAFACLMWLWALRGGRLFDLVPVARDVVFEGLADAVLVVDEAGRVIDHNAAGARAVGRSSTMVGLRLRELVGEEVATRMRSDAPGELSLLGAVYSPTVTTVRRGLTQSAVVLTLRDVTDERRHQAVREEARRLAEETSLARAAFLARMSHEVRSPLHGVVGAADLLLTSPLDASARRYAEAVASSSRVLLSLVDELLDFSKLDAERTHVREEDVDARKLADEVALAFAGAAEAKGLTLAVDGPAAAMRGDAVRLRQVLTNLVGNAVKFTDEGGIRLVIEPLQQSVRVAVEDTGIGIAPDAFQRIFEPFVQVEATPRAGVAGTGLGLSISRKLVALMGGELVVDSAVGRGSTFSFTLPAAARELTDDIAPRLEPVGERQGRVLVVEDDEVNALVSRGLLEREGCTVHVARSAGEALEVLRADSFELVLTDVRMPGRSGHELARELRETLQVSCGIVALTADVHDGARERALKSGMDDWLAKPVDPVQLRRVLDRWVPRRRPDPSEAGTLQAFLHADPVMFERIREAFRRTAPEDIRVLREAALDGRWPDVRARAHALKGSCAVVGADELRVICERFMSATDESCLDELDALEAVAWASLDDERREAS